MPGSNIRKIRESQKIRNKRLSAELGINPSTLSRIEKGKINPSLKLLRRIAEILNVPIKDFFE